MPALYPPSRPLSDTPGGRHPGETDHVPSGGSKRGAARGAHAENGSPPGCKRPGRACEALEARAESGIDGPGERERGFAPAASDGVGKRPREAGNTSDADWSEDRSGTRRSVTQRNRSRTEKTTERGAATCLTGCREAVTNCGTMSCPGRSLMRKREDREREWANHGAEPLA